MDEAQRQRLGGIDKAWPQQVQRVGLKEPQF